MSVEPLYNLLVTATEGAWDKGIYELGVDRFLEHTDDDIRERLKALGSAVIEELQHLPALFAL